MAGLLIFDLDGTLIDSRADLADSTNAMREHYGLEPLSQELIVSFIGNGIGNLIRRSLKEENINVDEAVEVMESHYSGNMTNKTYLYDGVYDGVRKLHKSGYTLSLISNKPTEPCKDILWYFGIKDYFSYVIGGGEFPLKPDPSSLNYVISQSGIARENSWMIGDNYTDIESGAAAGIKNCLCKYGFGKPSEVIPNPELEVESFSELVEFLLGSKK